MGFSILEWVLQRLREANFTADVAYPGQKYPLITDTVAAVHIEKVDRANMAVTVEVSIICPAAMGGTACEVEALRATEALRWAGAVCVQNGCVYDGIAQVYMVSILATFTGITEEDSCTMGPGFEIYINDLYQPFITAFSGEEVRDSQLEFATAEPEAIGISQGSRHWNITLEEQIPAGSPETVEPAGAFELRVTSKAKTETYYHCRWTSIRREFSQGGLKRIRKGISVLREEG